jgi:hypothetical protein
MPKPETADIEGEPPSLGREKKKIGNVTLRGPGEVFRSLVFAPELLFLLSLFDGNLSEEVLSYGAVPFKADVPFGFQKFPVPLDAIACAGSHYLRPARR